MALLLEESVPGADVEAAARRYVRRQAFRGELRWHQSLISNPRIEGVEHLRSAYAEGRGVLLNYLHHGHWEGTFAGLSQTIAPVYCLAFPKLVDDSLIPAWLQQHARICTDAGAVGVPSDAGFETLRRPAEGGQGLLRRLRPARPHARPLRRA